MFFALAVHLPAAMGPLYGEQDAARLVNDALLWTRAGLRADATSQYRYYTSPGYIWLVTLLLPYGPAGSAPGAAALNAINLAAAVLIVVPLYLLFRRIAGQRAAFLGTLLLTVIPAFWHGGFYGFPSLIAELFLVTALWLYDRWLTGDGGERWAAPTLVTCCACLTAAVLLKADIYLGAVALWGLMLYRRRLSWRNAAILAVVGVVPIAALYGVATALLRGSAGAFAYADRWRDTFPAQPESAMTIPHVLQVAKSMGLLTLPLFAAACVVLLRTRRYSLAAMLATWAALPIAFWFFRCCDSARHHFPSTVPVALGVGILLAGLPVRAAWRFTALALLVVANYFAFGPTESTITTSGDLFASARLVEERVGRYHQLAREYFDSDTPRKAFVGTFTGPYVTNEVLARADSVLSVRPVQHFGFAGIEVEYLRGGRRSLSVAIELPRPPPRYTVSAPAAAAAFRDAGWAVFSMQFHDGMRRHYRSFRDYRLYEF
jgi:hypothetical protein